MFNHAGIQAGYDIPEEEEFTSELDIVTAHKLLDEFRSKGGRYVYERDRHFHFEIKHW